MGNVVSFDTQHPGLEEKIQKLTHFTTCLVGLLTRIYSIMRSEEGTFEKGVMHHKIIGQTMVSVYMEDDTFWYLSWVISGDLDKVIRPLIDCLCSLATNWIPLHFITLKVVMEYWTYMMMTLHFSDVYMHNDENSFRHHGAIKPGN